MSRSEGPGLAGAAGSTADFVMRARARLHFDLPDDLLDFSRGLPGGDHVFGNDPPRMSGGPRAAAVLIPVVARPGGATVLLTRRASHLRDHSGQIAFPGGKIERTDASPAAAALREAREEIGLDAARATLLGYLDPYLTGTGFLIVPTVAEIREPFILSINPCEVDEAFEVPLAFLMDVANHRRGSLVWNGQTRHFYEMPFEDRHIWGITAGMIRNLYQRLYA